MARARGTIHSSYQVGEIAFLPYFVLWKAGCVFNHPALRSISYAPRKDLIKLERHPVAKVGILMHKMIPKYVLAKILRKNAQDDPLVLL